ncbi:MULTISPECIES: flagellin [Sulfitobacter]|uniref:flagellin n=1 Tax=Sulfitobacter TaxID=60136 RepID=UPI002306F1AF|nr:MULTISPECIES: flagellin [Sulfitobacter]MDF3383215.1 flagellin [Sulfitobacter sp. Ks11]MDF3386634.1 flagellin [Sulfitobacter sp. M85]MDF3390053.1 flagellin [Sulfitobacter sp. Ks16]MDF3400690.1 flagellin [Sulfitobacter sp. KE39]MDF3404111.1 flagellin [Sulfitobacter sp. Ks35]
MSSINTNNSAMNALATLRSVNSNLNQTQDRISTGLKVSSGKDNASYFAISETMKGDSGMTKAVNESLTLTKNSAATARVGAEQFSDLATSFREKVAFAQNNPGGSDKIQEELKNLVSEMKTTISQSTFNGDDLVNAAGAGGPAGIAATEHVYAKYDATDGIAYAKKTATAAIDAGDAAVADMPALGSQAASREVVTGVTRSSGTFATTSISIEGADLNSSMLQFEAIANEFSANALGTDGADFLSAALAVADTNVAQAVSAETNLGLVEKSIENQQEFLTKLSDNLDSGVGAMVDANMEEEAARLQALQVQQQLASQSLSIANQAPQNILSLFR